MHLFSDTDLTAVRDSDVYARAEYEGSQIIPHSGAGLSLQRWG